MTKLNEKDHFYLKFVVLAESRRNFKTDLFCQATHRTFAIVAGYSRARGRRTRPWAICKVSRTREKVGFLNSTRRPFACYIWLIISPSLLKLKPRIVTDLGGKTRAMELMSHGSQDVRYQALLSVQRLVSHPWQSV